MEYFIILWRKRLKKAQESRAHEGGTVAPWVELEKPQAGAPPAHSRADAPAHGTQGGPHILGMITCDSSQILNTGNKSKYFLFSTRKNL